MFKDALISVVVPVYNIDRYVGMCIESLLGQTYSKLEIILVDDGSSDRSGATCDLYARKDERIRVIHKPNGGLVSARKAGVSVATGDYIGYVDGDDWVEPDFYEALYRSAVKSKADIVCAGYSRDLFDKRVSLSNNVLDGVYEGTGLNGLWGDMLCCGGPFTIGVTTYVWNKLFRADMVRDIQTVVDERITIGEDAAVTYPALLRAKRVYVCDKASYHYRQREDSMLKQRGSFDDEVSHIKILYQFLRESFAQQEVSGKLLQQLRNFATGYVVMRSGGIVSDRITAFGKDIAGKRVAVISAGTFGQALVSRIKETRFCSVVGWFDPDYWEYRRCCMDVDPIEEIVTCDYDYVMIAKVDDVSVDELTEELLGLGVVEDRILKIDAKGVSVGKTLQNRCLELLN